MPLRGSGKPMKSAVKSNPTNSMETSRRIVDLGPITHTPTFADHIRMMLPHLKLHLPPGWFTLLRERKDQAKLSATEQERFLCAFSTLNVTPWPNGADTWTDTLPAL